MKIGSIEITYGKGKKFEDEALDFLVEILAILRRLDNKGVKLNMALNPEVQAFQDKVVSLLNNIAADIAKILSNPTTGLSDEDRAALQSIVDQAQSVSDIVPG